MKIAAEALVSKLTTAVTRAVEDTGTGASAAVDPHAHLRLFPREFTERRSGAGDAVAAAEIVREPRAGLFDGTETAAERTHKLWLTNFPGSTRGGHL